MSPGPGDRGRLSAFVDAAFAFAITLLVIGGGEVPATAADLMAALKGVPAFAMSFTIIALFWVCHLQWSRRYGLEDGASLLLSLMLVFVILVFVFPLRAIFDLFVQWLSGASLAGGFAPAGVETLQLVYLSYGGLFVLCGLLFFALHAHAWRCRAALDLTPQAVAAARGDMIVFAIFALTGLVSCALAWELVRPGISPWTAALPGAVYFALFLSVPLTATRRRR